MTPALTNPSPKKKSPPAPKPSIPGRVIVRLELTPKAKDQTVAVADRFGMTQIAALSRLVEWFAGQSEAVHAALLRDGLPLKSQAEISRMILEPIANRH